MAASILEGTLKTRQEKASDAVAANEVASIETNKIDASVSVDVPTAGRITDLLVNEEDTVTVGHFRTVFPNSAPSHTIL